ncbi:MAG: GIY-YIG nuclease family protein [Cellvibrionaceae bacterium]
MNQVTIASTSTEEESLKTWVVYMILSSDDRLYTGITNDVTRRWHAHCHTKQGAKFFRGRRPKTLLYVDTGFNRSSASKREAEIKKLPRAQKLTLAATQSSTDWHLEFELSQP